MANIPVGGTPQSAPQSVAMTPNSHYAYVANSGSDNVSVIRTNTNTVVDNIPVGRSPRGIAISPDGHFAWVTNSNGSSVSVIRIPNNKIVATIATAAFPSELAIAPDGRHVYVSHIGSPTGPASFDGTMGSLSVIDVGSLSVVATIQPLDNPVGVAVSRDGKFVYVTHLVLNVVAVIGTATNTVVTTVPVGSRPVEVTISPDGVFAYISNSALFGGSPNISVIDTKTNAVVATISAGVGNDPQRLAFTPDGTLAYVANQLSYTVSVIDATTKTVLATIPVGSDPIGVAITPKAH